MLFVTSGPYRFREVRKHVNVTFHAHNSSVAYRTQRSWFFDSETSNGSLHDTVTSINMIAAVSQFQVFILSFVLSLVFTWLTSFKSYFLFIFIGLPFLNGKQEILLKAKGQSILLIENIYVSSYKPKLLLYPTKPRKNKITNICLFFKQHTYN